MKKLKLFLGWFIFFIYSACFLFPRKHCAITNDTCAGRLGDQLIIYYKAKWLAYKYNVAFFLTSFPYSDQFAFSKIDKEMNEATKKKFKKEVRITKEEDLVLLLKNITEDTLFKIHLYAKIKKGQSFEAESDLHATYIKDKKFNTKIKKLFLPLVLVPQISVPDRMTTVAVHVRKGGGYDRPLISEQYFDEPEHSVDYEFIDLENKSKISKTKEGQRQSAKEARPTADQIWPTKFPPEQYYVDQIKKLSEFLLDAPLYVYIFTDDPMPQELIERFKKAINKQNIVFATRSGENFYRDHVVEDFSLMAQFDCLIRSSSGLSFMAQLIGSHEIVFFPRSFRWLTEKKLLIDKVGVLLNKVQPNDSKAKFFDAVLAQHRQKNN